MTPALVVAPQHRHVYGMAYLAVLPQRGVLQIGGEDRLGFLQGLVSNDVTAAAPGRAVWAALLTPQGKWLADFFIFSDGARLLLDCERAQVPMLMQKLARFRLRAAVSIDDVSADWVVHALWAGAPGPLAPGVLAAPDPRLPEAGWRLLAPTALAADAHAEVADAEDWDRHRLALGLPDGSRDLEAEKSVLLEAGFDELGGISWTKGCYLGQELTARTKYRGLLKRRLVPVSIAGPTPAPGSAILAEGGEEIGQLRSVQGARGLALLRLDALGRPARCAEATLLPLPPAWMARRGEVSG
jgi:folate-binding protein YgfZ